VEEHEMNKTILQFKQWL